MARNLSPEMQATQDQFIEALTYGPAMAEKMVNALAVEAVALEIYTDEWKRYEDEKIDIGEITGQGTLDELWADNIISFSTDIKLQHNKAADRYSHALWMLMNIRTQSE